MLKDCNMPAVIFNIMSQNFCHCVVPAWLLCVYVNAWAYEVSILGHSNTLIINRVPVVDLK